MDCLRESTDLCGPIEVCFINGRCSISPIDTADFKIEIQLWESASVLDGHVEGWLVFSCWSTKTEVWLRSSVEKAVEIAGLD